MYLIYVGAPMSVIRHGPKSKIAFRWFPIKAMGKFLGCEYIVPTKKNNGRAGVVAIRKFGPACKRGTKQTCQDGA